MVKIGALQSKSAPESKLSYQADPSTDMYAVDLTLHIPSLTSNFLWIYISIVFVLAREQ